MRYAKNSFQCISLQTYKYALDTSEEYKAKNKDSDIGDTTLAKYKMKSNKKDSRSSESFLFESSKRQISVT